MYKHTNGITLRKINQDDLPVLLKMKEEGWWGTHRPLFANLSDQQRWFESISSNSLFMMALHDETVVGFCGYTDIRWIDRICQVSGGSLSASTKFVKDAWACGLDFAFEVLNMFRIEAECLEYNYPAQQLNIVQAGLIVEGRKRQAAYKCGVYYDSLVLGLLRSEWEPTGSFFDHKVASKMIARSQRNILQLGNLQ